MRGAGCCLSLQDKGETRLAVAQLGQHPSEEELDDLLEVFDDDGSGELDFEEFSNLVVALGVENISEDFQFKEIVPKMSHYGHDHLVRWLHDDGDSDICEVTGEGVPMLQRCCRAIIMKRSVEGMIYFTILFAAVVSGIQNYSAEAKWEGEYWLVAFEIFVLAVFVLEAIIKFGCEHPPFSHYFHDRWNCFDFTVLVGICACMLL
eukprot:SAG31_NODE_4699_length_3025_cov_10.720096_3_plen_205_part_00